MEIFDGGAVRGGCIGSFAEDAVFEGPSWERAERADVVGCCEAGEEVSERRAFGGGEWEEVEPM